MIPSLPHFPVEFYDQFDDWSAVRRSLQDDGEALLASPAGTDAIYIALAINIGIIRCHGLS